MFPRMQEASDPQKISKRRVLLAFPEEAERSYAPKYVHLGETQKFHTVARLHYRCTEGDLSSAAL